MRPLYAQTPPRARVLGIALAAALLSVAGVDAQAGAKDVAHKRTTAGPYFDPHNHWPGGILEWWDFVRVFANGRHPDMFHQLRQVPALQGDALAKNPRVWPVTKALLTCDPVGLTPPDYERALEMMLTATHSTDWDSAYAVRSTYVEHALGETCTNRPELFGAFAAALLEGLAAQGITFSEQSASMSELAENTCWDRLADVSYAPRVDAPRPEVRFLAQLTNHILSEVNDTTWLEERSVNGTLTCERVDGPPLPAKQRKRMNDTLPTLVALPHVVGVDVLAPEKDCVTEQGMVNLKKLLAVVNEAAKLRGKRLVVRIHVGEGYPILRKQELDEGWTCKELLAATDDGLRLTAERFENGLPLHYVVSRANLERVLAAVREYRSSAAPYDDHMVVRLGHATHATPNQAVAMKKLRVAADVNLTSNFVTGSLTVDHASSSLGDEGEGFCAAVLSLAQRAWRMLGPGSTPTFAEELCSVGQAFSAHSLPTLLAADVNLMLGTDGPGIEHSSFYQDDYWAEYILSSYGGFAPDETEARVDQALDRLARNAWCHAQWVTQPPGTAADDRCR